MMKDGKITNYAMAKKDQLWYDDIDINTDWAGDTSTGGKAVAGEVVQRFIKSELKQKIGFVYHDTVAGEYLCFGSKSNYNEYEQDPTRTDLIISRFAAPLGYTASLLLMSPHYNAILLGQVGNKLEFGFDIKDASNTSYPDNISYQVVIRRNATEYTINGECTYGKTVTVNLDEYLEVEGTITATISIKGQVTTATASTMITYDVVNLKLSNTFDTSSVIKKDLGDPLVVNYSLFGSSNIKFIEWYIDPDTNPVPIDVDTHTGGTVEAILGTKTFSVESLSAGTHNVQLRAYVDINGEKFYTDTLYREFLVADSNVDDVIIAVENTIPKEVGIVPNLRIYDATQYEPYTFQFGVYNKKNLESVPVEVYIDDKLVQTINASNGQEISYTFISEVAGTTKVALKSGSTNKEFYIDVADTSMDISEITTNLQLALSAVGRINKDDNRASWNYGDYSTSFYGFSWTDSSGWVDNRLLIGEGMRIVTNINPLESNANGKTIEIEFETLNVINDDAVIADIRSSNGVGLLLTASEASLRVGTASDQIVSTKFKSGESIRISFVLDNLNKMALIYIDGIVSGAIKVNSTAFSVSKALEFIGSSDASIKLKQIRVYATALNADQILNNYILYRDTVQEMTALYDRNDILEGSLISIEKVARQLPVMLITGDVNWIETQTDKNAQTGCDAEYIDYQDPTRSFKMYGGILRLQGTSSSAYPKKNFRLYTIRKKVVAKVYDYQGKLVEDNLISFRRSPDSGKDATPVECWCLKADYAESSSTHNTGIATLWNKVMYWASDGTEGYVCRTKAQQLAEAANYPYDVRTTVDGFPIVVFARQKEGDDYVFIGKYNFNNDKSTENVFGFCDIPGFDDQYIPGHEDEVIPDGGMNAGKPYTYGNKMQCWEMLENGNNYALFQTTNAWHDQAVNADGTLKFDDDGLPVYNWASGFEARYPDDGNEADTSDLKAFCDWIIGCDAGRFAAEKKDHLDLWKVAAYYVYTQRFGAVDQIVKNTMFTSEDGMHWYFINYDNDTILGLKNTGANVYPPTITRETKDGNTYAYAGHESRLWNLLENDEEFMRYVSRVDTLLFDAGLTYDEVMKYFNDNQSSKWCERIYNQDATYKYINPSTTVDASGKEVNTLFMLQGSRRAHRTWWLAKRFKLMDGKFNNKNYTSQNIYLKLNGSPGMQIDIKAGDYMYYGCRSNAVDIQMGVELSAGDTYRFYKAPATEPGGKDFAVGDPIYIYAPYVLEELDLSYVAKYLDELTITASDPVLGTRLKKLVISSLEEKSQKVNFIAGISTATNLEYLDIRGLQVGTLDLSSLSLLRTLLAKDSGITSIKLADGCLIDTLQLSDSVEELNLINLPNLTLDNIEGLDTHHVSKINIEGCPAITNSFNFYYQWVRQAVEDDELTLSGFQWDEVNPDNLIEFSRLKQVGAKFNLKGKILITTPTIEQVEQIKAIFGEDCFTNNAEFWVSAPESVFIHGPKEFRSGDSQVFTTTIFSTSPGVVSWEIESGSEWVSSVVSNPDNSGVITTIEDTTEDHKVVIKAVHTPSNSSGETYVRIATYEITSKKVVYATSGTIEGGATIKQDEPFKLVLGPSNYNGNYTTEWSLIGTSADSGNISISSATNSSCIVKYNSSTIFDLCTLRAHVTNKNKSSFDVDLVVTVTDDSVLMTSTSNPEVLAICYDQGWCNSPDVMYKVEAQKVIDIGLAFQGGSYFITNEDGERITIDRPGSKITHFEELEEFKNILTIPDNAFSLCSLMTKVVIPANVSKIGTLAFQSTPMLSTIHIPTNVINIAYNAFYNSGIKEFTVGGSNTAYTTKDGVLISMDGVLVKYPEGKDGDSYTTNPSIKSLGDWSITKTKLRSLVLSDNMVGHGSTSSYSIGYNELLTTIQLGANLSPIDIAKHIQSNSNLTDITVSDQNPNMSSKDGAIYDRTYSVLYKYPEGRSYFNIEQSVKRIATYAVSSCQKLVDPITIPDSIEELDSFAFYSCQNVSEVIFSDSSALKVLGPNSLQLLIKANRITLPPSLTRIGSFALSNNWMLTELIFLGSSAPTFDDISDASSGRTITTAFGNDVSSYTGRSVKSRTLIVPADSVGYDSEDWINSILSESRNGYVLSKSLM